MIAIALTLGLRRTSVSCTLFALCREPIAVQADCRNVAVGPFNAPFDGSDDIVQR